MDQGAIVLWGIALFGLVVGATWAIALRVRAGSWEAARTRHRVQAIVAVAIFWALGVAGALTMINPQGSARTVVGAVAVVLLLVAVGMEVRDRTRKARA